MGVCCATQRVEETELKLSEESRQQKQNDSLCLWQELRKIPYSINTIHKINDVLLFFVDGSNILLYETLTNSFKIISTIPKYKIVEHDRYSYKPYIDMVDITDYYRHHASYKNIRIFMVHIGSSNEKKIDESYYNIYELYINEINYQCKWKDIKSLFMKNDDYYFLYCLQLQLSRNNEIVYGFAYTLVDGLESYQQITITFHLKQKTYSIQKTDGLLIIPHRMININNGDFFGFDFYFNGNNNNDHESIDWDTFEIDDYHKKQDEYHDNNYYKIQIFTYNIDENKVLTKKSLYNKNKLINKIIKQSLNTKSVKYSNYIINVGIERHKGHTFYDWILIYDYINDEWYKTKIKLIDGNFGIVNNAIICGDYLYVASIYNMFEFDSKNDEGKDKFYRINVKYILDDINVLYYDESDQSIIINIINYWIKQINKNWLKDISFYIMNYVCNK